MMKLTLKNSFHVTEAVVIVPESGIISKRQAARLKSKLCGLSTCACSGELGARGPQLTSGGKYIYYQPSGSRGDYYIWVQEHIQ